MSIENTLMFIGNELLSKKKRAQISVPMQFVSFAFVYGKLYKQFRNDGTFVYTKGRTWGNDVVYGAIFAITDAPFYMRLLDSYHQCSKSALGRNHSRDVHHREQTLATLISFNSLDDFDRLKYTERENVSVQLFTANADHPMIKRRISRTVSYRILNGVEPNLINLIREEKE